MTSTTNKKRKNYLLQGLFIVVLLLCTAGYATLRNGIDIWLNLLGGCGGYFIFVSIAGIVLGFCAWRWFEGSYFRDLIHGLIQLVVIFCFYLMVSDCLGDALADGSIAVLIAVYQVGITGITAMLLEIRADSINTAS